MMAEDLLLSSATKSFQVFSDLKSRIFQVETTARDTCAFAALRSSSAYSIIRIQSHEATPSGTFSPYIVDIINQFCFRNSLCDLSFNRCIDGFPKQLQCLSITDDGILYSWEMNDRIPTVVFRANDGQMEAESSLTPGSWYSIEHGSHPAHVLVASRQWISLIDLRMASNDNKSHILYCTENSTPNNEQISAITVNFQHSFQFAASTYDSILLLDSRYCRSPLLAWKHHRDSYYAPSDLFFVCMDTLNSSKLAKSCHTPQHELLFAYSSSSCDAWYYEYYENEMSGAMTSNVCSRTVPNVRHLLSPNRLATVVDDDPLAPSSFLPESCEPELLGLCWTSFSNRDFHVANDNDMNSVSDASSGMVVEEEEEDSNSSQNLQLSIVLFHLSDSGDLFCQSFKPVHKHRTSDHGFRMTPHNHNGHANGGMNNIFTEIDTVDSIPEQQEDLWRDKGEEPALQRYLQNIKKFHEFSIVRRFSSTSKEKLAQKNAEMSATNYRVFLNLTGLFKNEGYFHRHEQSQTLSDLEFFKNQEQLLMDMKSFLKSPKTVDELIRFLSRNYDLNLEPLDLIRWIKKFPNDFFELSLPSDGFTLEQLNTRSRIFYCQLASPLKQNRNLLDAYRKELTVEDGFESEEEEEEDNDNEAFQMCSPSSLNHKRQRPQKNRQRRLLNLLLSEPEDHEETENTEKASFIITRKIIKEAINDWFTTERDDPENFNTSLSTAAIDDLEEQLEFIPSVGSQSSSSLSVLSLNSATATSLPLVNRTILPSRKRRPIGF